MGRGWGKGTYLAFCAEELEHVGRVERDAACAGPLGEELRHDA